MTRLERIRRDSHGLDESKAITSEVYVPLASEPIGPWPTGRNRLVLYCITIIPVRARMTSGAAVNWTGPVPVSVFGIVSPLSDRPYHHPYPCKIQFQIQ
jgi:hypothetical protein